MSTQLVGTTQIKNALGSRILVVNDWSTAAVGAIAVGLQFIKVTGAELVVLNVEGLKILPQMGPAYSDLTILNVHQDGACSQMRALFDEHLLPAVKAEFPAVTVLDVQGDPASEIVKAAFDSKAGLIILGSGRRNSERSLLNEISGKVAKFAACSVLVVRESSDELDLPPVAFQRSAKFAPAATDRLNQAHHEFYAI